MSFFRGYPQSTHHFRTCVVTTEDEVAKGTARIAEANKFALPLVSDAWLHEAEQKKTLPLLAPHLIHCAGSVLEPAHESAPDRLLKRKHGGAASQTVVAKGGGAVDPASGLTGEGSTYAVLTEEDTGSFPFVGQENHVCCTVMPAIRGDNTKSAAWNSMVGLAVVG